MNLVFVYYEGTNKKTAMKSGREDNLFTIQLSLINWKESYQSFSSTLFADETIP